MLPSSSLINTTRKKTQSTSNEVRQAINDFYFCADAIQSPSIDHHLKKKTLNPLNTFRKINHKDITNPYLFRGAPMETTFVHSAGTRTMELWYFMEEASQADIRLAK